MPQWRFSLQHLSGVFTLVLTLFFNCRQETAKVPIEPVKEPIEEAPTLPKVDQSLVRKIFGAKYSLANKPLLADIDSRPGIEALISVQREGKDHQLALIRGNQKVLAQAPLSGKVLAQASIRHLGEFRLLKILPEDNDAILLPVETLVYRDVYCGILAFRYRSEMLSMIGQFASSCWRREAGGKGGDPFSLVKVIKGKSVAIEIKKQQGAQKYFWDKEQMAFVMQN